MSTILVLQSLAIIWLVLALRATKTHARAEVKSHVATHERLAAETVSRDRAEHSVREMETLLRLITNSLPVAIAYINAEQRYVFCNQVYAQWYGLSREQIIGQLARDIVGPEIYAMMEPGLRKVLRGHPVDVEAEIPYKDRPRFARVHKIPDVDHRGVTTGFVVLSADLSDQRRIQEDLIRAKEAADAANQAKSAFLANMSHEIRTPLGAILGFSDLLAGPNASDFDRENWAAAIKRNGDLLSTIINDILDLSKVEAGKVDLDQHDVPLSEVLTDVATLLNLKAAEKGIRLSITAAGPIPFVIRTDPLRLRQILINIVGNAIKFTQRGSVDVKITVVREPDGTCKLAFVVKDTGPGITPAQARLLFEPFTQADASTKRRFGGTGLGLALAKRLAGLLGGDVVLTESIAGGGSTFTITIDPGKIERTVPESFDVQGRTGRPEAPGNNPDARLDGMRILLAEDSQDNRTLVGRLLKVAGAYVETAENGRDAIDKAHKDPYDVVLMDIQMPDVDGIEATVTLRGEGYKTPIVALTAHAFKEERERCLAAGFNDHIPKPVDRKTLVRVLSHYAQTAVAAAAT